MTGDRFTVQADIGSAVDAFFRAPGRQMALHASLTLENEDPAHWAQYAFPMADPDGAGLFELLPPALPATQYQVFYRQRADPAQPNALITDGSLGAEAWDATVAGAGGIVGVVPVVGTGQIRQGDTSSLVLAVAAGSLAGRTALRFAAKIVLWQSDPDAEIEIDETLGLTVLKGGTPSSPSLGSITADAGANTVTVALAASATALLNPDVPLLCALKAEYGAVWTEIGEAVVTVLPGRVLATA